MNQPTSRVLWQRDLASRYGRDRTCIWRWVEARKLPPPDLRIGRRNGWYEATIVAHERSTVQPAA